MCSPGTPTLQRLTVLLRTLTLIVVPITGVTFSKALYRATSSIEGPLLYLKGRVPCLLGFRAAAILT